MLQAAQWIVTALHTSDLVPATRLALSDAGGLRLLPADPSPNPSAPTAPPPPQQEEEQRQGGGWLGVPAAARAAGVGAPAGARAGLLAGLLGALRCDAAVSFLLFCGGRRGPMQATRRRGTGTSLTALRLAQVLLRVRRREARLRSWRESLRCAASLLLCCVGREGGGGAEVRCGARVVEVIYEKPGVATAVLASGAAAAAGRER